jgi:hypothetical protein
MRLTLVQHAESKHSQQDKIAGLSGRTGLSLFAWSGDY